MIVITGAGGFIGSAMVWQCNAMGRSDILVVDQFGCDERWQNIAGLQFSDIQTPEALLTWLPQHGRTVSMVIHMGACSSTDQQDVEFLLNRNMRYSQQIFTLCAEHKIPLTYASSAACYGNGSHGFSDHDDSWLRCRPLNPYGWSKWLFDRWVMQQTVRPPSWYGLRFFNVYGPNEYHKGGQASVAFHAYNQVISSDTVKLFKSYHPQYADGAQQRDFVYVKDIVRMMGHLLQQDGRVPSGLYNMGSGQPQTFLTLANAVWATLERESHVTWIDMPELLRPYYQYHTCARMDKWYERAQWDITPTSIRDGVADYIRHHLQHALRYLHG